MFNTDINLSESSANRLLELLHTVPEKKRDITWNLLYREITRAKNIITKSKTSNHKFTILKCDR